MTIAELHERIREEIVLHQGQLRERNWRQLGLLTEAAELGLSAEEFMRQVNEQGRKLNFGLLDEIRTTIRTLGRDRQKHLTPTDLDHVAKLAERVPLTRAFVIDDWIPAVLKDVPDAPPATGNVVATTLPVADSPVAARPAPRSEPPAPTPADTRAGIRRKVDRALESYADYVPASALRTLFVALDYDETALAEEMLAHLSARDFAAEQTPQGQTVKEKLLSTDWRHLSWWEPSAAVAPQAAADAPAPYDEPAAPARPGWSDYHTIGLAVLVAVALIGLVLWLANRPAKPGPSTKRSAPTEGRSPRRERSNVVTPSERRESRRPSRPATSASAENVVTTDREPRGAGVMAEPTGSPATYEELVEPAGALGERRARVAEKWGYVDARGRWLIRPRYDDVTTFRVGPDERFRATVTLNGESFEIDRYGRRLR